MRTSLNGINLIKQFEGFSPAPYLCPANYLTIGYGHIIPVTSNQLLVTRTQAEELLRQDIQRFEVAILKLINVPLNQNQFDALISFTFNLGAGELQRSTLRQKINRNEHKNAAAEFLKWVYAGGRKLNGLVARRLAESTLYLT